MFSVNPDPVTCPPPPDLPRGKSYTLFGDIEHLRSNIFKMEKGHYLSHVYFRDATDWVHKSRLPRRTDGVGG